ncbi:MAG: SEL1-like repeat protein [Acidiferrobacter sp.]
MSQEQDEELCESHGASVTQAFAAMESDPVSGVFKLKALAEAGSSRAMVLLGCAYQRGVGVRADFSEAQTWYRRAETSGAVAGTYGLGQVCAAQQDYTIARVYFTAAAEQGYEPAQQALLQLDDAQREGQFTAHVEEALELQKTDPRLAFEQFRALAEERSWNAMLQLARCYHDGIGTDSNLSAAELWYHRLYECAWGDMKGRATHGLGWLYEGRGDYARAYEAFEAGAALCHAPSLYHLGFLYWRGLGVEKQPEKARAFFEQATSLGHLLARRNLGIQLLSGRFGLRLIPKGLALYFGSARQIMIATRTDLSDERIRM